jgi:hypothetical protein
MLHLKVETVKEAAKAHQIYFTDHVNLRAEERDIDLRSALYKIGKGNIVDGYSTFDAEKDCQVCVVFFLYQDKPAFISFHYNIAFNKVQATTVGWVDMNSNYWRFQAANFAKAGFRAVCA